MRTRGLINRAVSGTRSALPAWLGEGLAEFGNIDPGVAYDRYLEWGIDTGRIPPLTSLDSFPGDPDMVIVSYGQSRDVVRCRVGSSGPDKRAEFRAECNTSRRLDEAMVAAYGFDRRTLDAVWRESVGAAPLVEETAARTPTARPLPTFVPYTLENIGAAPTSTPAPDEAVSQPEATAAPEPDQESDNEGGSGGGCSAAGPGALHPVKLRRPAADFRARVRACSPDGMERAQAALKASPQHRTRHRRSVLHWNLDAAGARRRDSARR